MNQFRDDLGRVWSVEFDRHAIRKLDEFLDDFAIDLFSLMTLASWSKLQRENKEAFGALLFSTVARQASKRKVTAEDFYQGVKKNPQRFVDAVLKAFFIDLSTKKPKELRKIFGKNFSERIEAASEPAKRKLLGGFTNRGRSKTSEACG